MKKKKTKLKSPTIPTLKADSLSDIQLLKNTSYEKATEKFDFRIKPSFKQLIKKHGGARFLRTLITEHFILHTKDKE